MSPAFGREALRKFRERQARSEREPAQRGLLADVPPDAPMDDAVLTVWNGERFVSWEKWLASAPVVTDQVDGEKRVPATARCVGGVCAATRVWLVRDGDRWLMYVGSRGAGNRRRDFASPYLEHAIRTAEAWYGVSEDGWHAEERRDEKRDDHGDKQ